MVKFPYNKKWQQDNRERYNALIRAHIRRRKEIVLRHYGGGKLACVRCGFDDIRALQIDHIAGDGYKQRDNKNLRGQKFYAWLVRNNFPPGFQTLCSNCNWIKKFENNEHPNYRRRVAT